MNGETYQTRRRGPSFHDNFAGRVGSVADKPKNGLRRLLRLLEEREVAAGVEQDNLRAFNRRVSRFGGCRGNDAVLVAVDDQHRDGDFRQQRRVVAG